jgi:hypothetical protein
MKKLNLLFLFLLLISISFLTTTWAQVTTGNMRGTVVDVDGKEIPGANVVISSSALLGGTRSTTTNELGVFRFQSLPVGAYAVEVTLEGFQKVQVAKVDVRLDQTANIPLTMKLANVSEQLEVIGETPMIDVTQSGASTSFTKDAIDKVPTQRNFVNLMQVAPGVSASYGDGGGNGGGDRTIAFGSNMQSNSWSVDGLQLTAPETGSTWLSYAPESIEEIQVIGVGAPAEYGNFLGAVFNVVTKSGSNNFHGGAKYFFLNDGLMGENLTLPNCNAPAGDNPNDLREGTACNPNNFGGQATAIQKTYYDVSATFGGPIKKDRIWFYGDMQLNHNEFADPGNSPNRLTAYVDKIADVKGSGLIGKNTQVNGFYHWEQWEGGNYDPFTQLTALYEERGVSNPGWGAGLTSTLSNNLLLEVRYAGWSTHDIQNSGSPNVLDSFYDQTPPGGGPYLYSGGVAYPFDYFTDRHQVNAKTTYYADNFLKSQHEFRFGAQWSRGNADTLTAAGANGFYTYNYYGGEYYNYLFRYYQLPFHYGAVTKELGVFMDDTITVSDRLTLNMGLRFDHNTGQIPSYPILAVGTPSISEAGNWVETGQRTQAQDYMKWNTVSPRLGFVWQVKPDGKAILQGSFGVYYDHNVSGNWDYPSPSVTDGQLWTCIPTTGNPDFHSNNTPCVKGDLLDSVHYTNVINPNINPPRTLQYALGYEHQVRNDMSVGLQYVHKDTKDLIGWNIVGGLWEPVEFVDPWTGKSYTFLNQLEAPILRKGNNVGDFCDHIVNGGTASMCNQDLNYRQKYDAAIFTFNKRFSKDWGLSASYTWSHSYGLNPRALEQTQFNPFYGSTRGNDPNNWINAYGDQQGNRANMIRLQGFWQNLPGGLNFAANIDFSDGRPFTRQIRPSSSLLNQTPRPRVIMERGFQLDWFQVIDLTFGKRFKVSQDFTLEINGTIYNVLNANNALTLDTQVLSRTNTDAVFTETGWTKPRRLVLQVGAQF